MTHKKSYKFRIYPNKTQEIILNDTLKTCAIIYNNLLNVNKSYYLNERKSLSHFDMSNMMKLLDIEIYSQVKGDICKRVGLAYKNFFRRVKQNSKQKGFPKYKKISQYKSFTYPQNGFKIFNKKLKLGKIGCIKIKQHCEVEGKIKTLTIKKVVNNWYAILSCDYVSQTNYESDNYSVGIDVGISKIAVLSDGTEYENPKYLIKSQKKLAKLQRKMSKKKKGSKNRNKARLKVSKLHNKISNQRHFYLHKITTEITHKFQHIVVEDLQVTNMTKNHNLSKHILDSSWTSFIQMLSYKVERTCGSLIKVNPKNTSKTCSSCGSIQDMPLHKRTFQCEKCGLNIDRDLNASINIHTVGCTEINASGDDVRPPFEFISNAGCVDELGINKLYV